MVFDRLLVECHRERSSGAVDVRRVGTRWRAKVIDTVTAFRGTRVVVAPARCGYGGSTERGGRRLELLDQIVLLAFLSFSAGLKDVAERLDHLELDSTAELDRLVLEVLVRDALGRGEGAVRLSSALSSTGELASEEALG